MGLLWGRGRIEGSVRARHGHLGNFCGGQGLLRVTRGGHLMKGGLLVIPFKWRFLNNVQAYVPYSSQGPHKDMLTVYLFIDNTSAEEVRGGEGSPGGLGSVAPNPAREQGRRSRASPTPESIAGSGEQVVHPSASVVSYFSNPWPSYS